MREASEQISQLQYHASTIYRNGDNSCVRWDMRVCCVLHPGEERRVRTGSGFARGVQLFQDAERASLRRIRFQTGSPARTRHRFRPALHRAGQQAGLHRISLKPLESTNPFENLS